MGPLELLVVAFFAGVLIIVGRAYMITRYRLHIKALPGAIFLGSSMVLLVRANVESQAEGALFFLLFSLGLPFMVAWGCEFTKRMQRVSASGDFELGLPMPSDSHILVGVLGKMVQQLAKPLVTLEGPRRVNQVIASMELDEPAMRYVSIDPDGKLLIDPRSLPIFFLSDGLKSKLVSLVDYLLDESARIAGPSSKDEFDRNVKSKVGPLAEQHSELLIKAGLMDTLGRGLFSNSVSTGLVDLDLAMKGGYPKNAAILLCGPPSDERSMIVNSFIQAGLDRGDSCLFAASSQPPEAVNNRFSHSEKLVIVDCYTNRIKEVDAITVDGNVIVSPVEMSVVGVAVSRGLDRGSNRLKRAVIDILPTYLVFQSIGKVYLDIMEMIDVIRKAGYTAIFSLNPYYVKDQREISTLEELFDGIMNVERLADAQGMRDEFALRIEKMANLRLSSGIIRIRRSEYVPMIRRGMVLGDEESPVASEV